MKRNISIDLLKVIACFSVIILHVIGMNVGIVNSILYYIAGLAVPVFFMVNGYLLFSKVKLDYKYIRKKIINILIVVFSWNVLISIVYLGIGKFKNPLIDSIFSLIQMGYFWQFWFFGALIIVYCFVPILFDKFKNLKLSIIITLLFCTISILVDFTSIIRSLLGYSIIQSHIIQTFRLWTWFSYFLLGALISKVEVRNWIYNKFNFKKNYLSLIILTIIVVFYQYNVSRDIYHILYAEYFYDNIFTFLWILSLFLFVYRIDIKNSRIIKIIEILSLNTIGIYIIHVTVIKCIDKFYNFQNPIINILMVFIIFLISLVISVIIRKIPYIKNIMKL